MALDSFTPAGLGAFTIQVYHTGNIEIDRGTDTNTRHIPGGNTSYIDIGGLTAPVLTTELFFSTSAAFAAFASLIGKTGVLAILQNASTPENYNVVLTDCKRSMLGLSTTGETRATAVWTITS
ncbi:MAG TPA: hypothetical protein VN837_04320 [Chloroflexota bacterium]|nr:hypothetical protein [Chloroflexota bacterium]